MNKEELISKVAIALEKYVEEGMDLLPIDPAHPRYSKFNLLKVIAEKFREPKDVSKKVLKKVVKEKSAD